MIAILKLNGLRTHQKRGSREGGLNLTIASVSKVNIQMLALSPFQKQRNSNLFAAYRGVSFGRRVEQHLRMCSLTQSFHPLVKDSSMAR